MKRMGNIIFWIIIAVLAMFILYNLYNRYKPDVDFKQLPQQETNQDRSETEQDKAEDKDDKSEQNQETGKKAEVDFTLEDLDGNKVRLSDYRGKIVVLNFWTTWCPYCVDEMPDLDAANTELLKGDDAVILTIDVQESADKVRKFVSDRKLKLPVLMDYDGQVAGMFRVPAFPTTYVINKDGTIYGYNTGAMTKEQILNVVNRVKQEQ